MNNERMEELAVLYALNLLDEAGKRELLEAARLDPKVNELVRDFTETAALLAYEAPGIDPPPQLKEAIMSRLPVQSEASNIIRFPQWIPYAIAAGLMILGIVQTGQIVGLKSQVRDLQSGLVAESAVADQLRQDNALKDVRLAVLQQAAGAQVNAAYASSHILVAWNPKKNQGIISMRDLPAPPPGHDYQLWLLDPKAANPINAGVITTSQAFAVQPVSGSNPGFAISLEPTGGRPKPTGPILFAAAPEQ